MTSMLAPGAARKLEPGIRRIAEQHAAPLRDRGSLDAVRDYAAHIASGSLCLATGRPMEEAVRLRSGVDMARFTARTGLGRKQVEGRIEQAIESGLLKEENRVLKHTALGWRFINEIQAVFLP